MSCLQTLVLHKNWRILKARQVKSSCNVLHGLLQVMPTVVFLNAHYDWFGSVAMHAFSLFIVVCFSAFLPSICAALPADV